MINLLDTPINQVAKLLLLGEDDAVDIKNLNRSHNGTLDEAEETEKTATYVQAVISFSEVATDEFSAFPKGEVQAVSSVQPGENSAYANAMVVTFDDYDEHHSIIITGEHSGAGNSDESQEGYFNGWMMIVSKEEREKFLAKILKEHRARVLSDMADRVQQIVRQLNGISREEIESSPLMRNIGLLNRAVANS